MLSLRQIACISGLKTMQNLFKINSDLIRQIQALSNIFSMGIILAHRGDFDSCIPLFGKDRSRCLNQSGMKNVVRHGCSPVGRFRTQTMKNGEVSGNRFLCLEGLASA